MVGDVGEHQAHENTLFERIHSVRSNPLAMIIQSESAGNGQENSSFNELHMVSVVLYIRDRSVSKTKKNGFLAVWNG
jgi:hypothetical protein